MNFMDNFSSFQLTFVLPIFLCQLFNDNLMIVFNDTMIHFIFIFILIEYISYEHSIIINKYCSVMVGLVDMF